MDVYNCAVVGDLGVGKTTYIDKLVFKESQNPHSSLDSKIQVKPFSFNLPNQSIQFNLWEISGDSHKKWLEEQTINQFDCGLVCFDLNDRTSLFNSFNWGGSLLPQTSNLALIGLKFDLDIQVDQNFLDYLLQQWKCPYFEISSHQNLNLNSPWVCLNSLLSNKTSNQF